MKTLTFIPLIAVAATILVLLEISCSPLNDGVKTPESAPTLLPPTMDNPATIVGDINGAGDNGASPPPATSLVVSSVSELQNAISSVRPGDVVQIRGGVYYPTSQLTFTRSGTESAPITWMPYPGETVVLDGSNARMSDWEELLRVSGDWNIFEDLEIRNNNNTWGYGIRTEIGGDYVVFLRLNVHDNHGTGIEVNGSYDEILYCTSHDNYGGGHSDGMGAGEGIGHIIRGCVSYHNADDGIDTWQARECLIEDCVSYNNGYNGGDGCGLKFGGDSSSSGYNLVRRCVSYNNSYVGFTTNGSPGSTIEHCTAYNNGSHGAYENDGGLPNTFRNNIADGSGSSSIRNEPYNTWSLGISNPGFISTNPSSDDFLGLQSNSPCRGKADDGSDLGALQYGERIADLVSEGATPPPTNQPPVLASIGSRSVNEEQILTFTISATDPDGDSLTYSASNLPSGATFTPTTKTFTWTPTSGQAGRYSNVHFQVSDDALTDAQDITITVNANAPPPPSVDGSGGVASSLCPYPCRCTTSSSGKKSVR